MTRRSTRGKLTVLMVAAECKGFAQVGGLADVVADLSRALAASGVSVAILIPGYESIGGGEVTFTFPVEFGGNKYQVVLKRDRVDKVLVYHLHSREFFSGSFAPIYIDSGPLGHGPFEDDSLRFAFFCSACATLFESCSFFAKASLIHCHDWHTGTLIALAKLSPSFPSLSSKPFLFTIHNLRYQGIRPLRLSQEDRPLASFESWFPHLGIEMLRHPAGSSICDRKYRECYNPMRAGILLASWVTTVSPTYAQEICLPDDPSRNFVGGCGLEEDLQMLRKDGRLSGILNGIFYQEHSPLRLSPPFDADLPDWPTSKAEHKRRLFWTLQEYSLAHPRTRNNPVWSNEELFLQRPLAVAVSRLASQKLSFLLERTPGGVPVLDALRQMELTIAILGTGEMLETLEREADEHHSSNFLIVPKFDTALAKAFYAGGDIFLMPSDFEPCGIAQMISMRYGTVPVACQVGGLSDTIKHGKTGFLFSSPTRPDGAACFLQTVAEAVRMMTSNLNAWRRIQTNAMRERFDWDRSASLYLSIYKEIL